MTSSQRVYSIAQPESSEGSGESEESDDQDSNMNKSVVKGGFHLARQLKEKAAQSKNKKLETDIAKLNRQERNASSSKRSEKTHKKVPEPK